MKFKIKTLFAITFLIALLVGSVVRDLSTQREVQRQKEVVEEAVQQLAAFQSVRVNRSEHRNDFVLYSSGRVDWNCVLPDLSSAQVKLSWNSRPIFTEATQLTLTREKSTVADLLVEELGAYLKEHNVRLTLSPSSR